VSYFAQRQAILATMHQKEKAIAPLLKQSLDIDVIVPPNFDSDRFGTFTRDVDRPAGQLETARIKALAALEVMAATIAIASEGSFSPHPALPFLPCDRELVVLIDPQNDLEIVGEAISTETNFSHAAIASLEDALKFAQKIGFPSHGLVVMPDAKAKDPQQLIKGITTEPQLIQAVTQMLEAFGQAHLETDMRAMHNPTRMKVIQQATQDLIRKATSHCPSCQSPGFAVVERRSGLPCELCSHLTDQTLAVIYRCPKCQFEQAEMYPNGIQFADPMYCDFCNP
jgi:predicted Zn-ribbon and HTH transcriptional regulator